MNMKETWKPVTISGFTGIMMGAASTYAMQHLMNHGSEAGDTSSEATADYDSMSFKDAFDAARDAQGPGGVFTWHGNVYNTYTVSEWNAKTNIEKQQFAEQLEVNNPDNAFANNPDGGTVNVYKTENIIEEEADVRIVEDNNIAHQSIQEDDNLQTASTEEGTQDDDVRIIEKTNIEFPNGHVAYAEVIDFNGQHVAVIDLDRDGTPDIAMSDLNHNHQMDEGEVIDLHTGEELTFANDDTVNTDMFDTVEI